MSVSSYCYSRIPPAPVCWCSVFWSTGALRFMRKIIGLKDEFYSRYIIKGNLFKPVVDAFLNNNGRYNLLDSAIVEMFEFIKVVSGLKISKNWTECPTEYSSVVLVLQEDMKSLIMYIVETFGKLLESVEYVQTFKMLRLKYNQHQDRLKDREKNSSSLDRYEFVTYSCISPVMGKWFESRIRGEKKQFVWVVARAELVWALPPSKAPPPLG